MKRSKLLFVLLLSLVMVFASAQGVFAEEETEEDRRIEDEEYINDWTSWELREFDPYAFTEPEDFEDMQILSDMTEGKAFHELLIMNDMEQNTVLSVKEDGTFDMYILGDLFTGTWENDGEKCILIFDQDEESENFYLEFHRNDELYLSDADRTWQMELSFSGNSAEEAYQIGYEWGGKPEKGVYSILNEATESDITPLTMELSDVLQELHEEEIEELLGAFYPFGLRPYLGKWIAISMETPFGKVTMTDENGKEAQFFPNITLKLDHRQSAEICVMGLMEGAYYHLAPEDASMAYMNSFSVENGTLTLEEDMLTLECDRFTIRYMRAENFEN